MFQLQAERNKFTRDKETDSLVAMYEANCAKGLLDAIENAQEALTVMGFFPVFKER
jgi:hypothetical protein